ncbi:MAG: hypothetical protein J4O04_06810 [Chloroflexi bacterium]|nr:hypothetical protein [Chloroflexota bacterium]
MNLEALPYAVLLILAEFSVGSLIAVLFVDARGMAPSSYVKLSAGIVAVAASLMLLSALNVSSIDLEGYRLKDGMFGPVRTFAAGFFAISLVYCVLAFRQERERSLLVGGLGAIVGVIMIGLLAYQVSPPTWGFPGPLSSLLVGTLALGFVSEAMLLGHWYLVSPKMAGRPMEETTAVLFGVMAVQALLLIVNAAIPVREAPETAAVLAGSLASNPAFWLRVGVGLLFPLALAFMAWRSSLEYSMMSATGLLYIAVGGVFVGEVLARGLLFVTGAAV